MRASIERLRWGLVAVAVVLLLVLAIFLGYGRYKQLLRWKATLAMLHLHGPHETTDFTYSSSPKDRTSYKVHAAKVIEHGDGKWSLYDVDATVYSKTGGGEDHITASDVEYDQKTGVASVPGQAQMKLQLPSARGAVARKNKSNGTIDVATSGLVYVRKLGIAATSQAVTFQYAGMQCTSQGAEFDPGLSVLHLLANVVMTGTLRDAAFTLHAAKADLNRQANTVALLRPVAVSAGKTVTAGLAVMDLREDGSLQGAKGSGGVSFAEGTRRLVAAEYSGTFGVTSLPLTAKLSGGVVATDNNTARPVDARAKLVDAVFDATGAVQKVIATGAARMMLTERRQGEPELPREVQGERVVATFDKDGGGKSPSQLHEVDATGGAMVRGVSMAAAKGSLPGGLTTTQMNADALQALFVENAARKPELWQVYGNGHARLEQDAPMGARRTSASDTIAIAFVQRSAKERARFGFAPQGTQIDSVLQRGNVVIHSVPAVSPGKAVEAASDATAAVATYIGWREMLVLRGEAFYAQGGMSLRADRIGVDDRTDDASAVGSVMASLRSASAGNGGAEPVTHVAAERAQMLHASGLDSFFGTDARPARLWQGASQVQAESLVIDQTKKTMLARAAAGEQVHAVFANTANASGKDAGQVVRVASTTMQYDDGHREAVFTGGVRMDGETAQARSDRATVFLSPAKVKVVGAASATPFGGSLERIVLSEHVRVEQPGRTGVGEQLVYTPDAKGSSAKGSTAGTFVLTGAPGRLPHMVDAQQGSITGAMLVFHGAGGAGDSTIIVSGATPENKQGRVRTEVEVRGR